MGRMAAGRFASANRASGYIAFYPCLQPNSAGETTLLDRSGKGNHATLGTLTTAEAWGTLANRFATLAAASKKASLPKAALAAGWRWNAGRRDSLLIHMRARVTPAAANFLGNANATGEGGFKFVTTLAGNWAVNFYDAVNTLSVFSASTLVDGSWGSNDHSLMLYLDGPNNAYSRYVDGVLLDGPLSLAGVTVLEPQGTTFDLTIGGAQLAAASTDARFLCIHILSAPQSYGSCRDPALLARRLHQSPLVLVQRGEWPY